jgi:hypothetical protein
MIALATVVESISKINFVIPVRQPLNASESSSRFSLNLVAWPVRAYKEKEKLLAGLAKNRSCGK